MKNLFALMFLVGMAVSAPVSAGTRSCTSSMVSLNICRSTSDVAYCLAIGTTDPDAGGPLLPPSTEILDAFASQYGWVSPTACTQEMVSAGICNSGQLGTSVAVTKAQFADMQVRFFVRDVVRRHRRTQAINSAAAAVEAQTDPDLGQ